MSDLDMATFQATGHGSRSAWIEGVERDVEVTGNVSQTANHSTFYPKQVIDSALRVNLAFRNSGERNKFNDWMLSYSKKLTAGTVGAMQIVIPTIGFSMWGVPTGDLDFGSSQPSSVKHVSYTFEIVSGQVGLVNPVTLPSDPTSRRFYPTGFQGTSSMLYTEEDAAYEGTGYLSPNDLDALNDALDDFYATAGSGDQG